MATLVEAVVIAQPVTTPPQIEIDLGNKIDRWVFVGTGKLYDDTDLSSTQTQTMYAVRDGTWTTRRRCREPRSCGASIRRPTCFR